MLFREFTVVACEVVSDVKVVCYGQLCALRCIYYTEDDLLKVRATRSVPKLVQLTSTKQHKEL